MAYRDLQQFIERLDKEGELLRIKAYVDPKLEIAEITDRISKLPGGGKALLFENTGYPFPNELFCRIYIAFYNKISIRRHFDFGL